MFLKSNCYLYRNAYLKTRIECIYTYEGKILHKKGETHSRLLNKNKRKQVSGKVIKDDQTQRHERVEEKCMVVATLLGSSIILAVINNLKKVVY